MTRVFSVTTGIDKILFRIVYFIQMNLKYKSYDWRTMWDTTGEYDLLKADRLGTFERKVPCFFLVRTEGDINEPLCRMGRF